MEVSLNWIKKYVDLSGTTGGRPDDDAQTLAKALTSLGLEVEGMRIVGGLLEPSGGNVLVDGHASLGPSREKAMVFQLFNLFPHLTAAENITLGLTGAYSRRKSETRQVGVERPFNPVNEDRLNVNARGSYGFSTNVTGNVLLGFGQDRDLQRAVVRRSVLVELRASFTF